MPACSACSVRAALRATSALVVFTAGSATALFAQDTVVLDQIVIESASRDSRTLNDLPATVSVIDSESIAREQPSTFEELVSDTPGLLIDGGPRGIAQEPNIRGFADNQILLRVDGGRQNFNLGHQGRFFIDPEAVKQVEVVRGGGSTLYGSGALGGVLAVETVDASDFVADGQTFGGRQTLSYSSNGDGVYSGTTLASDFGVVDVLGYAGFRDADNLDAGGGDELAFTTVNTWNALFKIGVEPTTDQRFELSFSQFEDDSDVPAAADVEPTARTTIVDREASTRDFRFSYDFAPEGNPLLDLSVLVYSTDIKIDADALDGTSESETNYETLGFEIVNRSEVDLGVPTTLVYGFETYRDTQSGSRTAPSEFAGAEATTIGAFVDGTFEVSDAWTITAGLRFDSYERDPDDATLASVDKDFVSPRIGVSYNVSDAVQVYGNLSRSFRSPTISELYAEGRHFDAVFGPLGLGTNSFIPNPDLEPEEADQIDIGLRYDDVDVFTPGDRLSFGVSAYYAEVKNFIDLDVTGPTVGVRVGPPTGFPPRPTFTPVLINGGTSQSVNTDAELWGVEAQMNYDAGTWFAAAGLSIPSGRDDNDEGLGSIQQDMLSATLGFRPNASFEYGFDVLFAAEKDDTPIDRDTGQPIETDSFTVVDFFGSYRPQNGALAGSTIRFGVDNAFDEEYFVFPTLARQAGRSYKLSVSYEF
ncbi:MAG: TonB-dependent hemoglobin/transferrin/lactoferrin family receptor [Pseudomonadota bacterium]